MDEYEVLIGGGLCVAVAVGILVSVATGKGGTFASRMTGIGIGTIVLVAGLSLTLGAYRTNLGMLMPLLAGAAFVGIAGGLLYRGAHLHRRL